MDFVHTLTQMPSLVGAVASRDKTRREDVDKKSLDAKDLQLEISKYGTK